MGLTQVSTSGIKDATVATADIADGAVQTAKLAANAVQTSQITDDAVTSAKIADANVTAAKLASGVTDLSNDTTPQLGGNLDTNGNNIQVADNDNVNFGASSDLYIKHSSGHNANFIVSYNGDIEHHMTSSKKIIKGFQNSGTPYVALYQDGNTRFYTRSNGGTVQGTTANVGIDFSTDGSHRGTVYANSSNQIGFLDSGGDWAIKHTNDDSTKFYVQTNQKATIDADGLKFGTDTAAANALDDYEEGTWTPSNSSYGFASGSTTEGNYTKIGDLVYLSGICKISSNSSGIALYVDGAPFTAKDGTAATYIQGGFITYSNQGNNAFVLIANNGTRIYFYKIDGSDHIGTNWDNAHLRFTVIYKTA